MSYRTPLLASAIGILVIAGFVLSGRSNENQGPETNAQKQNPQAFQTITSDEGGVEVAVTPLNLVADLEEWSFEVSMNTHSVELSEDMVQVSKLTLDSGETINPSSWEGDPPGGHHRGGILKFQPTASWSKSVQLKISGVGGAPVRIFSWTFK